jgi:CRISPR-associated protein Cas1
MSHHILHLLSHHLRVRVRLDQIHIRDLEKDTDRAVPLEDVAAVIAASPDLTVTSGALRRMAELGVLMLVCDEKFQPCCLTLPYYRATDTELLRRQIEWTQEWKTALWRQIITAKIRNQAANLLPLKRPHTLLAEIATRCENGPATHPPPVKVSLATVTASRRAYFLSDSPAACESRAARHYWKHLLPRLSETEKTRDPGTREGVNGMLDYGYAILRTVVLRSLAAHGFIAAIGIHHAPKAGSFALADDLMEPLRPWCDRALIGFLKKGGSEMKDWIPEAAAVLAAEVRAKTGRVRLLHATDLYVQSFADAALRRNHRPLAIPMLT